MAKVNFPSDIASISGKLCSKDGVVYSVNSKTGKTFRVHRHGYNDKNSAEQQAVRQKFVKISTFGNQWWRNNQPTTAVPDGSADYQTLKKEYDAQHKYGNILAFVKSKCTADGKITIGGVEKMVNEVEM